MGKKTSFFHEVAKVEGVFTSNRFVSMIRCSKHFWGTCFHPDILMSSYLLNWRKLSFSKFWHFSVFWPFLRIFSLLKIAVNSVSAILTNSLRLKNIWILSNNEKYEILQLSTFVEFWSTLILLISVQHFQTWNYILPIQIYILFEYIRYWRM